MNESHRQDRRRFLVLAGRTAALCLTAPVLHGASGCSKGDGGSAAAEPLRIPLHELPEGERIYRELAGVPLEIQRHGDQVVARSMLCTHQGCVVIWQPDAQEYVCPCHEGRFDADGKVVEGMPTRPLARYPVQLEQDVVVIGP